MRERENFWKSTTFLDKGRKSVSIIIEMTGKSVYKTRTMVRKSVDIISLCAYNKDIKQLYHE